MSTPFQDHVVWITGGGSGIGRALALEFAHQGAAVAVSGRREDRLRETATAISEGGGRALAVPCDVRSEDDLRRCVDTVTGELGRLDVAVANAGFGVAGAIEELTADDWRRQLETNVVGVALTARHALPALRASRGRMVLVSSVSGMLCTPKLGAYQASKYAVRAIGQTLAMELAGSGASCTTVFPGFVESEIAQVDNRGRFDPDRVDRRPRRLMWSSADAARVIVRAVRARKREYVFTVHGKLAGWLGRHAPGLVHWAVTRSR